jgi:AcrR family transcriptional regulator
MSMRRAYRPEEKEERRRAILAGTQQMLMETPFPDLRMTDLAARLGLAKGTLYLYFATKEALFLAVLRAELGAWFDRAEACLDAIPAGTGPARVAGALVAVLRERPLLPRLQALLHGVLEGNLPEGEALAFARSLQEGVQRVGARLERVLPGLKPSRGAQYLTRFHGLVVAGHLLSGRPPVVRAVLQDPDMALFDFRFDAFLGGAAADLLRGMLA